MTKVLFTDIETRSSADLKTVGQRRYACDPSTQITCATWQTEGENARHGSCFIPRFQHIDEPPEAYFHAIQHADKFVAHNASFDVNVINAVYKINIPVSAVVCTMAEAQSLALPAGLDNLADYFELPGKMNGGRALVMATCKPQRDGTFLEDEQVFRHLTNYCRQDLNVLIEFYRRLPRLNPSEREIFERTWRKNAIGLPVDLELARAVAERKAQIDLECTNELRELTGGAVTAVTQRDRILRWFKACGHEIENTRKETIESALDEAGDNVPAEVIRVLEIIQESGGSAPTKAATLLQRHVNGRYLDATRYFGARSGRGTSEGVNTFNIARPSGKHNIERVIQGLKSGNRTYDNVALTDALRGMICAPAGYNIVDADEKNGELRIALWYAGDSERLRMLANDEDLYSHNGRQFFGIPTLSKKTHPLERQLAKTATLGGNYGCGGNKFAATVKKDTNVPLDVRRGFNEERGQLVISAFRRANPLLCAYETGLWARLDRASRSSLAYPGTVFEVASGKIAFQYTASTRVLWLRLPSGRVLPHYDPYIDQFGDFWFYRARHGRMMRQKCYGGAWLEIICQATLRDVVVRVEKQVEQEIPDATLLLDIYDSVILLAPEKRAEAVLNHVVEIMGRPIPWAPGLPTGGEGYFAQEMRK